MKGPCLCGDPACWSCGDPGAVALEAAEEKLMEKLAEAKLSAEEYDTVLAVGLAAVECQRKAVKESVKEAGYAETAVYAELEALRQAL